MHGLDPIKIRKIIKEATDADFEETSTADKMRDAGFEFPISNEGLMRLQLRCPELFKEFEEKYKAVHQHHAQNAQRFIILTEWDRITSVDFQEHLTQNVN